MAGIKFFLRIKSIQNDTNVSAFNKMEVKFFLCAKIFIIIWVLVLWSIDTTLNVSIFPQSGAISSSIFICWNLYRNYKHSFYDLYHMTDPLSLVVTETNPHNTAAVNDGIKETGENVDDINGFVAVPMTHTKKGQFLKSLIAGEFVADAEILYHMLIDIYDAQFDIDMSGVFQEIAAFAATKYHPCIECGNLLKFSECDKDYNMEFGVMSMLDEFQNVKYYINEYNDQKELLCRFCALTYGIVSDFMLFPRMLRTFEKLRNQSTIKTN
eukprot:287954_1